VVDGADPVVTDRRLADAEENLMLGTE